MSAAVAMVFMLTGGDMGVKSTVSRLERGGQALDSSLEPGLQCLPLFLVFVPLVQSASSQWTPAVCRVPGLRYMVDNQKASLSG